MAAEKSKRGGARLGGGRPALEGGKRVNLMLDDETIEKAKLIGGGNTSAGVRRAVAFAFEQKSGSAK